MADRSEYRKGPSGTPEQESSQGLVGRAMLGSALFLYFTNWPLVTLSFEIEPGRGYLLLFCYWIVSIALTFLMVRIHLDRDRPPPDESGPRA